MDNDAGILSSSVGAARYEAMDASPEIAYAHRVRLIPSTIAIGWLRATQFQQRAVSPSRKS